MLQTYTWITLGPTFQLHLSNPDIATLVPSCHRYSKNTGIILCPSLTFTHHAFVSLGVIFLTRKLLPITGIYHAAAPQETQYVPQSLLTAVMKQVRAVHLHAEPQQIMTSLFALYNVSGISLDYVRSISSEQRPDYACLFKKNERKNLSY